MAITFAAIMRILLIFFMVLNSFHTKAGDTTEVNIWRKPKVFIQLDRYNSLVSGKGADVSGLKGGLEFGKKFRFGLGIYNLKSDIIEVKRLTPDLAAEVQADTVKAQLNMGYIPICFEYIFYEKGRWQFGLPVHLGFGGTYFTYYDRNGQTKRLKDHPVILTDVVVSGQYKIIKWVGIGAGIGFRKMLVENPNVERTLNSPLYNIRLKIFLGEIYRSLFPNGICKKKQSADTGKH